MKKYVMPLVLLLLLGVVVVFLFYSRSIFQEGNPLPVLYGVVKLSTTEASYTKIDEHKYLVKANAKDVKGFLDYLAQHELVYTDQQGAAYFFKSKNGKTYMAISRMFSTSYGVFDFSNTRNEGLTLP
jgi:hypothetical protein